MSLREAVGGFWKKYISGLASILSFDSSGVTLTGDVTVRQDGGVAGTDEIEIKHDGTDSFITSQSGDIKIQPGSSSQTEIYDAGGVLRVYVQSSGNLRTYDISPIAADTEDVGAASLHYRDIYGNTHVLKEQASAPTGVSNKCILFCEDNGGGKTRLMAIFGSGAAQQVAIEP